MVSRDDLAATAEPTQPDASGWKVWNPGGEKDGLVEFSFQRPVAAFEAAGTFSWTVRVTDRGQAAGASTVQVTVLDFTRIDLLADPVGPDGKPIPGAMWGGWSARPGETGVESQSFLKLTNSGAKAGVVAVLDFNEDRFAGPDPSSSIPIDGNIEFAVWSPVDPAQAPSRGAYVWQPVSVEGTAQVALEGTGSVAYIKYRIRQVPDVLLDQSYSASLTLSAV
jgi:hypothetical protein